MKLLPCPFCGQKPELWKADYETTLPFRVRCLCGSDMGYFKLKKEAIKAWNARKDDK